MNSGHVPVMLREVVDHLVIKSGIYVDCTIGVGGHTLGILEANPYSRIFGIDVDPSAIVMARDRLKGYEDRVSFTKGNFVDLISLLDQHNISEVDGVLMDLGVSSIQLDTPERGFSFRYNSQLDMRMDQTTGKPVSYEVNKENIDRLTEIIKEFGEERWAKKIARNIVTARGRSPITTTAQLAEIIERSVPRTGENIHPATRTFQALRIYKNSELENLESGLDQAIQILKTGSRICVISFHSLEDRIVKNTFRTLERGCICPPKIPMCICGRKPMVKVITKRPIVPSSEEIKVNPRSRSSKMRVAEKL